MQTTVCVCVCVCLCVCVQHNTTTSQGYGFTRRSCHLCLIRRTFQVGNCVPARLSPGNFTRHCFSAAYTLWLLSWAIKHNICRNGYFTNNQKRALSMHLQNIRTVLSNFKRNLKFNTHSRYLSLNSTGTIFITRE